MLFHEKWSSVLCNTEKKLTHFPFLPDHAACTTLLSFSILCGICQALRLEAKFFIVQAMIFG